MSHISIFDYISRERSMFEVDCSYFLSNEEHGATRIFLFYGAPTIPTPFVQIFFIFVLEES